MRSIFVIIVHFGTRTVTDEALASLKHGSRTPDHVIIIDHGSASDAPENKGYAAGLTAGIRDAERLGAKEHDLVVLMNNDIIVTHAGIEILLEWWDAHGGLNVLAGVSWGSVSLLTGRARVTGAQYINNLFSIPYIHGSCMALEYGLALKLAFPAELFMYWEDVVLSLRVQRLGAKLTQIPFQIIHHNDSLDLLSQQKLYYLVRNGAYMLEREAPYVWRLYWHIINSMRHVYHGLYRSRTHEIIIQALSDARAGRLGKITL